MNAPLAYNLAEIVQPLCPRLREREQRAEHLWECQGDQSDWMLFGSASPPPSMTFAVPLTQVIFDPRCDTSGPAG
jgi:hypothetical protein